MKKNNTRWLSAVTLLAFAILLFAPPRVVRAQDQPRVIQITAKRFGFTPSQITVKKGETVTLRFTSDDVTHGIFARPLKLDSDIVPGSTTDVTITPQATGQFTAICHHFCGANHGNMHMLITVED